MRNEMKQSEPSQAKQIAVTNCRLGKSSKGKSLGDPL